MIKNKEGKWVDGRGAKAKYHLQVRSNSKMMEMTSYYIDKLCGDGTPPRETVMTARAVVNKTTGELSFPKKTLVRKYSFTYAMAFDRLSQGRGLVSRPDRETLALLEELIGLVRQVDPMATDVDTKDAIINWHNNLRKAYDSINNGQKPIYLTDMLGCWPEQLQWVMKKIYDKRPDEEWRINLPQIIMVLKQNGLIKENDEFIIGEERKKSHRREYWREPGKLEYNSRYNIRTSTRFPADYYSSDKVRDWLEWIYDVPVCTDESDRNSLTHDINIIKNFIKDTRQYPRTIRAKERIGINLIHTLCKMKTTSEHFLKTK